MRDVFLYGSGFFMPLLVMLFSRAVHDEKIEMLKAIKDFILEMLNNKVSKLFFVGFFSTILIKDIPIATMQKLYLNLINFSGFNLLVIGCIIGMFILGSIYYFFVD